MFLIKLFLDVRWCEPIWNPIFTAYSNTRSLVFRRCIQHPFMALFFTSVLRASPYFRGKPYSDLNSKKLFTFRGNLLVHSKDLLFQWEVYCNFFFSNEHSSNALAKLGSEYMLTTIVSSLYNNIETDRETVWNICEYIFFYNTWCAPCLSFLCEAFKFPSASNSLRSAH